MATKKSQRIGILIIAAVMAIGTIASFLVLIIAPNNEQADRERIDALSNQYAKEHDAYQVKVDRQTADLSRRYYPVLKPYESRPAKFDAKPIRKLSAADLKQGTGEVIGDDTEYAAYYIGWTPDGKVFDQSIDGNKLKAPLGGENMIEGWTQGVKGMKLGGVRELTIPADLAYGKAGTEGIPPDTPLKFVVLAIPQPETIKEPQPPKEIMEYYKKLYGL